MEFIALLAIVAWIAPAASGQSCTPAWDTDAGDPGITGGTVPAINALAIYDDGSGPALYAAGSFSNAGGNAASNIAKWNGSSWSALGSGLNFPVLTLAVYDDGSGSKLYAGGLFTQAGGQSVNYIATWNGTTWASVGGGLNVGALVRTMFVYDDGGGDALYIGGTFYKAGTVFASNIVKWDGATWSPLGAGVDDAVFALAKFDDGGGAALYVGGEFDHAGGVAGHNYVTKWDGANWSSLGVGLNGPVTALIGTDSSTEVGGTPALYVGGNFDSAGGVSGRNFVAQWDGTNWSGLGVGVNQRVLELYLFDDATGAGSALYASGRFITAGGNSAAHVAKWNGATWSGLGAGANDDVNTMTDSSGLFGLGARLAVGGTFTQANGVTAERIAEWVGCSSFADCNSNGIDDPLDISGGTSADCNNNNVPDECDISGGADDCQLNGVPDVCELAGNDCNADDIPDDCQLAGNDCNSNSIPDGCDEDCDSNGTPDDCETHADCNSNSIPDVCELMGNDCNADEIPDDCQLDENDCNTDGIPDDCQLVANDCNNNGTPDDCEPDCNTNGVADECDIAGTTSEDFNENGVPDECEVDCQPNGVPDYLDLLFGVSEDCNANEVPDECDRVTADLDGDGAADPDDHTVFINCLTGALCESAPCTPAEYADPCCIVADYDEDGDVDLIDWMGFQSSYQAVP